MAEISGRCDERFEPVRQAFANNLDQGLDVGACVAVFWQGEPVVDIWGGHLDTEKRRPWQEDTIINVWSTTKTMTNLCALVLADRGEIDLHAPVARYWPEFSAGGKEGVEVRHLLAHSAGLSGWSEPITVEDLYDWEKVTSLLAGQEPWWQPGSSSGYHAVTQGYLVGEVIRRVAGVSVGRFFADEVAGPLGADFFIGTPAEADDRVALVIPPEKMPTAGDMPGEIAVRTFSNPALDGASSWAVPWRRAEIPAAGGHGNARSVATIHSAIACGGEVGGTRLMSRAGCEAIFEEQTNGPDLVLGVPIRFGMGFGLSSEMMPGGPRTYFWGGWGGSIIVTDLDTGLSISYVMNRMESGLVGDLRGASIVLAAVGVVMNELGASPQ